MDPTFLLNATAGGIYPLLPGERLSMGRSNDNDIPMRVADVGRRHARVEWREDGIRVFDHGSTNGVFAHGQRIDSAALTAPDEFYTASTHWKLRSVETADEAPDDAAAVLEAAMVHERPLRRAFVDRLIRGEHTELFGNLVFSALSGREPKTLRLDEGRPTDWRHDEVLIPPDAEIRIAHPAAMPHDVLREWSMWLADFEVVQPFPQIERRIFRPGERLDLVFDEPPPSERYIRLSYRGIGLASSTLFRSFPTHGLLARVKVANGAPIDVAIEGDQTWIPYVVYSEVLRDMALLLGEP